jgi:HD-like signal output (HDOD) protein
VSVLHRYFKNEFARITEIVRETDLTAMEAEESVLGVTHAEIGGWLAERWNLPDHLVEAITLHHQPTRAEQNKDLVALIHCADVFACKMNGSPAEFDKGNDFDRKALDHLQLNDDKVLADYMTNYRELLKQDLEQVTQMDVSR